MLENYLFCISVKKIHKMALVYTEILCMEVFTKMTIQSTKKELQVRSGEIFTFCTYKKKFDLKCKWQLCVEVIWL
jgi:hypothetical protein